MTIGVYLHFYVAHPDDSSNLALSCNRCNLQKGPNLTGIDQLTNGMVPLFHPRKEDWQHHFRFEGARIIGITPTGRVTVQVLSMNESRRLDLRLELLARRAFP